MLNIAASLTLPLRQMADRAFLLPLAKGVLGAIAAFVGLILLADWGASALAGGTGWLATVAGLVGGILVLVSAIWLFVPVALALAGLFLDETAQAVEDRFYPGLPRPDGASLAAQLQANLVMAAKVLGLTLVVLPLGLVMPLVGAVLVWALAAVSLGDGLFEGVAQRRMTVPEARALRRRRRPEVLAIGGVLAFMALIPVVNLLVPVYGTAAMTHLFHRGRLAWAPAGRAGGAPRPALPVSTA